MYRRSPLERGSHSMLAFLLHDVLSVLQHLFLPQVKEVRGIGVKLQGLFPVIPTEGEVHIEIKFNLNQQLFAV